MPIVLGVDAAWTASGSSGVALLRTHERGRSVIAVAPSYDDFIGLAEGREPRWDRPSSGLRDVTSILSAASALADGEAIDAIAIDMPISMKRISGRRPADDAVSREFGRFGAAVHSPNSQRPDPAVTRAVREFVNAGFPIRTTEPRLPGLFEVYPLAALTRVLGLPKRPPYKVSKMARYGWPGPRASRIAKLLESWAAIVHALEREVGPLPLRLPDGPRPTIELKAYEDALDAIVCAWVGARIIDGSAQAYPDNNESAAIWIPS